MARSLLGVVGDDFRLEDQRDAYRNALEQVVAARLKGLEPPHAPAAGPVGGVVDLMAALERSIQAAEHRRARPPATKKTAAAPAKKAGRAKPKPGTSGKHPTG
jgi:DNA end-binding protein Ku